MALPIIIKNIRTKIDDTFNRTVYRNLVFKGGGVRGIAYMGALEVLDELDILRNIERVAGTSAGAIAATITSFRLDIAQTWELFNSLDYTKYSNNPAQTRLRKLLEWNNDESYRRFFTKYGWHSSQDIHQWLEEVIAGQCDGNRRATFTEFQERGFRDLYIVAANISRHRAEVFSAAETPDVAVADAVRMSISIPIFFEALRFDGKKFGDGDYYVDGGLYDNFPMHIFDQPEFAAKNRYYKDKVNWRTLGLFLYPEKMSEQTEPVYPDNVWEFMNLTLKNAYTSYQVSNYQTHQVDKQRTIEISDCGISPLDFNIVPGSIKYNKLYDAGMSAVRSFFEIQEIDEDK